MKKLIIFDLDGTLIDTREDIISFVICFFICAVAWHNWTLPLHQQNETDTLKNKAMNTNITLSNLSSMFSSEDSYRTLVDMINEMDLELMDISLA